MKPAGLLILLLVVGLPVAWFVSEFYPRRWLRITLGLGAIVINSAIAFLLASVVYSFNYNSWYGGASKELIDTTVSELEEGRRQPLLSNLKQLQAEFQPTYENRARYDLLVEETVDRIKKGGPPGSTPTTRPDSQPVTKHPEP